jgi:DNA replication protein DnaC
MSVGFTTAAALVSEMMEARDERRLLRLQKQMAARILEMNGDSYRLAQSRARKAG